MTKALTLAFCSLLALPALAQRAEVLVLGTYHMANPGHDMFNMQADDVLAPKRQQEIAEVIDVLKKFHPTKIAVESSVYNRRAEKEYADYLAGKYTLTRNEIDQIGYRLAKELGHSTIYAIDIDGEFPFQSIINFARASGRSKELEAIESEVGAMVKAQNDYLASHTVLETLRYINADERIAQDVGYYFRYAHFGERGDWPGAELLASWYRRNIRIFSNIAQLAGPNERILIIYGYGHLGWLQQDVANDPTMRLRKLAEFAK
jgi:uncharacterized protein DUF5694